MLRRYQQRRCGVVSVAATVAVDVKPEAEEPLELSHRLPPSFWRRQWRQNSDPQESKGELGVAAPVDGPSVEPVVFTLIEEELEAAPQEATWNRKSLLLSRKQRSIQISADFTVEPESPPFLRAAVEVRFIE